MDDVEYTRSMLPWRKGLIEYSDIIKRTKVCGVENLLIFVVPFSPPETLNTSFQLELALQINNGYREEKIKDRSWKDCSGHDIPECPFVPEFVVTIFWELLQLALKPHQGVEMIEIQEALVSSKAPSVPLMHRWSVGFLNSSFIDVVF